MKNYSTPFKLDHEPFHFLNQTTKIFILLLAWVIAVSFTQASAQCTPQGDPAVFGDHVWNVYAWDAGGASDVGTSWNTNYSGYYVETALNFNTENFWGTLWAPSDASSGYLGCPVATDNHSWSAKRKGFTCGYYIIDIPGHDDMAQLFIDGLKVWEHNGCCDSHSGVWSGNLGDASTIEFRTTEGTGGSFGSITITSSSPFVPATFLLDCNTSNVTLNTIPSSSYLWSTGETTPSITVSSVGSYSVTVTNNYGCSFTGSMNVINSTISLSGPNCLGNGNLAATFNPLPSKLEWKLNDSTIQTSQATYNNINGSSLGTFSQPWALFIDKDNNFYATDRGNHRILKWIPGVYAPVVVAGGNGEGSAANQLSSPSGLTVDDDGNLYILDQHNNRIQKWAPGASSGVTVEQGSMTNILSTSYGIAVDETGNIYTADPGNHCIRKWAPGSNTGQFLPGYNGAGNAANQFFQPYDVLLDTAGNIYVADAGNHRIQKWAPGATSGITVAGGNGAGGSNNQLNFPTGIIMYPGGDLIIANYFSSRVVRWKPGASSGAALIFGLCCETSDIALGRDGTLYVSDIYGSRIWKYPVTANSIGTGLTPLTEGDYTIVATGYDGCVLTSNTVSTHNYPTLTVSGNQYFCEGSSTTLDAGTHQQYSWSTGATTQTETISTEGSYALSVSDFGCSAGTSLLVNNATPNVELSRTPSFVCAGQPVQLNASLVSGGGLVTKTYYLPASAIPALTSSCANGIIYGTVYTVFVNWADSGSGSLQSATMEFTMGYEANNASGSQYFSYLNNSFNGSFNHTPYDVSCSPASPANRITLQLNPTGYHVGGSNQLFIGKPNPLGWGLVPDAAWNNEYIKVTAVYKVGTTTYTWEPGNLTGPTQTVSPLTTTTYTLTASSGICAAASNITISHTTATGDPVVYGDHVWNVYTWNAGGASDTGTSWNTNYAGYYVDSNLNFHSGWSSLGSPSEVSGFLGCQVQKDNHSYSAKRQGFHCGIYQIDIPSHDDEAQLLVNGIIEWEHDGCCDSHPNVWTGLLNESSTVEFRVTEGSGGSESEITLNLQAIITVNGPTTICPGYSLQLTASNADSYLWSTGETTPGIMVNASGTYTVDITTSGCINTVTQSIIVAPLDTLAISSIYNPDFVLCAGDPEVDLRVEFTDPRYDTITWSGGNVLWWNPFASFVSQPGEYFVTASDVLGCTATSHVTVINGVAGEDSTFGNNAWKVNAYIQGFDGEQGDYYYYSYGRAWHPDDYAGYYLDNTLNFNSQNEWIPSGNPTNAAGYSGCPLHGQGMSWSAKRRGFPCGIYQIDIPSHDNDADLWVNGGLVWEHMIGCCDSHSNVWQGALGENSTVEFRVNNRTGNSSGSLQFNLISSTGGTYYADVDNDGYGNPAAPLTACSQPGGYVLDNTDCNDAISAVHPGVADICNTLDDNCNGQVDENAIAATITPSGLASFCGNEGLTLTANSGSGISYQWVKGSANIAGATSQTYHATKTASYKVKETNAFGCNSTSAATSVTKVTKPTATITALGSLNICATGSVQLHANSGIGYTYQWMKGAANIVGAINQDYVATKKGTYKCVVTNSSNCSNTSNSLKVTKSCKAGDEEGTTIVEELTLYPNPSSGEFMLNLKIDGDQNEEFNLVVMNMVGQIIYSESGTMVNEELNEQISLAPEVTPGVYFVRIMINENSFERKLVIVQQ